jgi:cytochrome c-type biogenesis protein
MTVLAHAGLGAALAAFAAGLLSFFSPCVAPLVPGYIGYLSGLSAQPAAVRLDPAGGSVESVSGGARIGLRSVAPVCLLFVAGFSVAFVALGLASASLGRVLIAYQPVLETIAGIVMVAMGAFLLDLLPRGLTSVLLREGRLRLDGFGRLGVVGPFALGIVFAAGWTPCIGPVLGAVLMYVSASADLGTGTLLLSLYALGFALPFLGIGLGWARALRALGWVRSHAALVARISGVGLIVVGIVYLTGEVSVFANWAQQFTAPGSL